MLQTITEVKTLFSFPEKEYKLAGGVALLTPSLSVANVTGRIPTNESEKIGFLLRSRNGANDRFWELHYPVDTAQTYLGLKLLSECPVVEEDTLCACYYAMGDELNDTARHYIASLKDSGFKNVEKCRLKLLNENFEKHYFSKVFLRALARGDVVTKVKLPCIKQAVV